MAFTSREEYERWKQARSGGPPPLPQDAGGAAAAAVPAPPARKGFLASFEGLPGWAWLFCGGCLAIPVVTLGGAVPVLLGLGGASLCNTVARKDGMAVGARVALCATITLIAWGLLVALLVAVGGAK